MTDLRAGLADILQECVDHLREPAPPTVDDMAGWRPEKGDSNAQSVYQTAPPCTVTYLRSQASSEGGHQIECGGRRLWVLPDGHTSGQRRSRLISQALGACEGTKVDPVDLLYGALGRAQAGVLWDWGTG